jgi:predicted RNase H-like HicB family nuclease
VANYSEYRHAAMRHAIYERQGSEWFATVPDLPGLWGSGDTLEDAREDLLDSFDGWLDAHIKIGQHKPPVIDGVDLFAPPKVVNFD